MFTNELMRPGERTTKSGTALNRFFKCFYDFFQHGDNPFGSFNKE
jgi:hypothetical protein